LTAPHAKTQPPAPSRYDIDLRDDRELALRRLTSFCRAGFVSITDFRWAARGAGRAARQPKTDDWGLRRAHRPSRLGGARGRSLS
jgi:hypothetical protein